VARVRRPASDAAVSQALAAPQNGANRGMLPA
jgi:hypothetical protein